MRYRRLDSADDCSFGHQQNDFLTDRPETVAQAVLTRLRLWSGEWFIDSAAGTPYQGAILGKHTGRTAEPAIRARILETEGVNGLQDFSFTLDRETRKASVSATINTVYGTTQIKGIL